MSLIRKLGWRSFALSQRNINRVGPTTRDAIHLRNPTSSPYSSTFQYLSHPDYTLISWIIHETPFRNNSPSAFCCIPFCHHVKTHFETFDSHFSYHLFSWIKLLSVPPYHIFRFQMDYLETSTSYTVFLEGAVALLQYHNVIDFVSNEGFCNYNMSMMWFDL